MLSSNIVCKPSNMSLSPIVLSIPIFFILIGVELLIQHFSKKKIYRLNDAITNLSCGITSQITGIFLKIGTIALYQLILENLALFTIPVTWWSVLILFLLADMLYYWGHRMSHEINLFWGSHVVHHQSEDYNLSVALRQSSFQTIWTFGFYLPLAVLGFDTVTFALVSALITLYQFWIHTETIDRMGVFEYVFNTPSHHRVHHGRDPKYIDKNHAGTLIIWDKIFGTYQQEEETPTYGITKPINSWNPLWANFDHYVQMASQAANTPGLLNKLGVVFNKPGWRPQELGGYQPAPPVRKSEYLKYDVKPSPKINLYVFFQFVVALIITSYFLFTQGNYELLEKGVFSGLVIISVVSCGGLLEKRSWSISSEWIRVIWLITLSYYYYQFEIITLILSGYALLSIIWLQFLKSEFQANKVLNAASTGS